MTLGGVRLTSLVEGAEGRATPLYVYDLDGIVAAARDLSEGFGAAPHLIAYAVKANSAGPIVRALAEAGCGADVVSGPELELCLRAGVPADRIVYSGVGKTLADLDAALGAGDRGILAVQVESVEEIPRVEARAAALGRVGRVSVRLNPGIDVDTHAHVATGHDEAKFGVPLVDLPRAWEALGQSPHLRLVGLTTHIGSQLMSTDEYLAAADELMKVARAHETKGAPLEFLDFGGGFGIDYGGSSPLPPSAFARAATLRLAEGGFAGRTLVMEPGRALVGPYGVLVAGVIMHKHARAGGVERDWLVIDAGMNDLVRPALYQALHRIEPLSSPPPAAEEATCRYRVVGPVCESSDDFGEHPLPRAAPKWVGIRDAGAYGFTMASEYNGRRLATEVFLRGGQVVATLDASRWPSWVERRLGSGSPPLGA
jgi:diaminopimelate decarboxylase